MLADQHLWDNTYPTHHIDNNRIQNVGSAIIHQYKSPYALQPSFEHPDHLKILTHCQKCNKPFKQPITLICGYTLCLECLPSPSTQCLSFSCLRTHTTGENLKPTILLENVLSTHFQSPEQDLKSLLDCSICLSRLVEPITTECGHTFCKNCLLNTMTKLNTRTCPFCRTILSRIGKVNKIISDWINYLYNNEIEEHSQHNIPIIQVNSTTATLNFPTQPFLIQIIQDKLKLLNYMINHSYQNHYAICIFSKNENLNDSSQHGIMLKIHGVECIPDIRHSVVQASALFRVRINHLTIDDGSYTGDIIRLDDSDFILKDVITTHSTPTTNAIRKITKPRPCSMRLSHSAPSNYSSPSYSVADACPGSVYRKVWANGFNFPSQVISKQKQKSCNLSSRIDNSITLDTLFYNELHSFIIEYVSGYTIWMMQYESYLRQQNNLNLIVWWAANILPLSLNEKVMILGMDNLRERMIALILWADKWRSCR